MKSLFLLLITCFTINISAKAKTNDHHNKPFVFIENGVEFIVFKNGTFDFNILPQKNRGIHINTSSIRFSINSNHHRSFKNAVRYNRYGDVVQVKNTPIYYNRYGNVNQIGKINICYNRAGFINNIGRLNIYYNRYGVPYKKIGNINRDRKCEQPYYRTYKGRRQSVIVDNNHFQNSKQYNYRLKKDRNANVDDRYYPKKNSYRNNDSKKRKSVLKKEKNNSLSYQGYRKR